MMLRSPTAPAAVLFLALTTAGCHPSMEDLLDPASRERLATVPGNENVLLSLTGNRAPDPLPPLDGGRALGRSGNSVLLEVPRGTLPALTQVDGLRSGTVWGGADLLGRLDPGLLPAMLEAFDAGVQREPMPMIARFGDEAVDPRPELEAAGATIGSMAGGIVTLQVSPEAALSILRHPHLIQLSKPKLLHPNPVQPSPETGG